MGIGQTARVTLPDGQITNGTIVSVSAASLQSPALETSDYVPVENPLRARIEAEDESTAALWRSYLRMDVEVAIRR